MCKNGEVVQRVVNCASDEWCLIDPIASNGVELQPNCVKGTLNGCYVSNVIQYKSHVKG